MQKILVEATENGLQIPSEYNRALIKQMVKDGVTLFELRPRKIASKNQQGFLEGAVVYSYCKYQYNLDPRDPKTKEVARDLFKQDWWYDVIKDKNGKPKKVLKSWSGEQAAVLDKYNEAAPEIGAPLPNPELYKLWDNEYSMDLRWNSFWDWLLELGIEEDAMPSRETLSKLL